MNWVLVTSSCGLIIVVKVCSVSNHCLSEAHQVSKVSISHFQQSETLLDPKVHPSLIIPIETMAELGSPTLENLPKVDADFKAELEKFKPELMKKASTQEKIVLPSAEDVKQERRHSELIHGLEHFNKEHGLKHAETDERVVLPNAQDVAAEKTQQSLLKGLEGFDQKNLKHAETHEKIVLPDKDVIETEKVQLNLMEKIETFDSSKLKPTETKEKNQLPTKEVIDQEKSV